MSLHYHGDNSYLLLNGKGIFKFTADNGDVNIPIEFCLGSICKELGSSEPKKYLVYNVSLDDKAINKSNILNIHK